MAGDGTLIDPVIDELRKHINAIADMCNANIKPWEPDAAYRAVRLFNEIAKPYIDCMCDYMSTRPKSSFQIPVFQFGGKLYPILNSGNNDE